MPTRSDSATQDALFTTCRPSVEKRGFVSEAVERTIAAVKAKIAVPELAWLFENCFPNTLDTTVTYCEEDSMPDTYVITGDIDAMWLRDSSAQVWPYVFLCNEDEPLRKLIAGVIRRQAKCVLLDPYANAFYNDPEEVSEWKSDKTLMLPGIHERKWEIDSLCYTTRLAYGYWKTTGDTSPLDELWEEAADLIVKTFKEQQRKEGVGPYEFERDGLNTGPYGSPVAPTGMICSRFRPSDDPTEYQYLIPSNLFAAQSLRQMAEILTEIRHQPAKAATAIALAEEVEAGLEKFAKVQHPEFGEMYAFEVDGLGNQLLMDDSNVPSLLSLPYLGIVDAHDPIYQNTRKFVLSLNNPWYFEGEFRGIGGPHIGIDYIWPMAIILQGLTSIDDEEIADCVKRLVASHGGTGFMHESFHKNDPKDFTRSWFAWANTLFGEFIVERVAK